MRPSAVIQALDVDTIYAVTARLSQGRLRRRGLPAFRPRRPGAEPEALERHRSIASGIRRARSTIAIVGKYTSLLDAYKSLAEALRAWRRIANNQKVNLNWIDSEIFEREDAVQHLDGVHGILVPGGFGERGAEGKIQAAPLRPRAQGAVFRHLLRHADGGDRGGAQPGRREERELDRVRRDQRACRSA